MSQSLISSSLATVAYLGAAILFILSLGGLSNPETSRRGNLYGIVGMTLAVIATIVGPRVAAAGIPWIIGALVIGGGIGLYAARMRCASATPPGTRRPSSSQRRFGRGS